MENISSWSLLMVLIYWKKRIHLKKSRNCISCW